jgi:hypothetical protein
MRNGSAARTLFRSNSKELNVLIAAESSVADWPEAAVAIAGIALVTSVVVVALWQLLATWRARMAGSREAQYRQLAEQSVEAQARTTAALEEALAELRRTRESDT